MQVFLLPTVPFEFSTDRGLYGGTYVGLIGGAVATTSVSGVLQFDLNANDRFAAPSFPTALIYNSLASTQKVAMNTSAARRVLGPSASADIYETTTDSVILSASLASAFRRRAGSPARAASPRRGGFLSFAE